MERGKVLGLAVGLAGGVAIAVQSRVNGQLGARLGDGLFAALVSFGVGLAILAAVVASAAKPRAALRRLGREVRSGRLRPWQVLGGVAGACYVTTQGLTIAALGVAVFTVAVVAGQVVSSLVVDRAGLGPAPPQPVTARRALGAALAVVAVGVAVSDEFSQPSRLWLALLPALGGAAMGWQQAVNGLVSAASGSVRLASMVNFAVGGVALALACGVDALVRGLPGAPPAQWWLYTGGALGVLGLSAAVYAVRLVGVLLLGLAAVAGQLLGALLLDAVAPPPGGGIGVATVAGVAVTLVAVVVAAGSPARRSPPARVEQ